MHNVIPFSPEVSVPPTQLEMSQAEVLRDIRRLITQLEGADELMDAWEKHFFRAMFSSDAFQ